MITIFVLVVLFLALFAGLGLPLARRLGQPLPETLFAAFFMGWGLALAALQVWHLLLPVNGLALVAALAASLGGWALAGRPVWRWLRMRLLSQLGVMGVLAAGLLFLLVNQALYSPSSYDHGLYHLPMVRWLQAYPIVPGLGNLHHRFAFNNASFLVVAMLDSGPQHGLVYYTATTLLYASLALRGLLGAYRSAQGGQQVRDLFYTLMLPVTLWVVTRPETEYAGYSTDSVVFVFQAILAAELLHAFEQARLGESRAQRLAQIGLLVFGAAVGLAVKASFAVFGVGIGLAGLWAWWSGPHGDASENWAALLRLAGIAAAVIVPWLARGVLLSGYLLYPSGLLSLPVRWKIPTAMVEPVAGVIRTWAMHGGKLPADVSFGQWLPWWLQNLSFEIQEAVVFSVLLLVLAGGLRLAAKAPIPARRGLLALLGVTLAGLVFWFVAAPSPRFAGALLWMLPLIPGLMLLQQARTLRWLRHPNAALAVGLVLLMLWLQPVFTNKFSRGMRVIPPRESELAAKTRVFDPLRTQVTLSRLAVYLGADENEELCFDQPLPCTRANDFNDRLSLLEPGRLGTGFWIEP